MSQTVESPHKVSEYKENVFYISLLVFAGKELIMPQSDIVSVESIYELSKDTPNSLCLGHIVFRGNRVPVYSLSGAFDLMTDIPDNRVQCVIMQHENGELALLCEQIRNTKLHDIQFDEIPACMNHAAMPLTHLAIYQAIDNTQRLGLVTNADCMADYINTMLQRDK